MAKARKTTEASCLLIGGNANSAMDRVRRSVVSVAEQAPSERTAEHPLVLLHCFPDERTRTPPAFGIAWQEHVTRLSQSAVRCQASGRGQSTARDE
jgi:hypothetical protein